MKKAATMLRQQNCINSKQAEKLYKVTRDFAELSGTETVYDLYCGTGSIGIFVSGKAKKIIGVEMIAAEPAAWQLPPKFEGRVILRLLYFQEILILLIVIVESLLFWAGELRILRS